MSSYIYDVRRPAEESPMALALIALGIKDPVHSSARESIYTFVCHAQLAEAEKARRIELVKQLQNEWLEQQVCRVCETHKLGKIQYLRPTKRDLVYSGSSTPSHSFFEAYVHWYSGKKSWMPLNLIKVVPRRTD